MEDLLPELTVLFVKLVASCGLRGDGLLLFGDLHLQLLDAKGEVRYLSLVTVEQRANKLCDIGIAEILWAIVNITSGYRGGVIR